MKTITLILGLFLAVGVFGQQDSNRLCFKRENQAKRQICRLNIDHHRLVNGVEVRPMYTVCVINDTVCYCVNIEGHDLELRYGLFNRPVIKPRHVKKYYVKPEAFGLGYDFERFIYNRKVRK